MARTLSRPSQRRRPHPWPALLAWLLLTLQVPWHAGMQAGAHADNGAYQRLAATLGIDCGPAVDPAMFRALVADGQLDRQQLLAAQQSAGQGKLSLCKLFTGLSVVLPAAVAFVAPSPPATPALARSATPPVIRCDCRRPPARAPPLFA